MSRPFLSFYTPTYKRPTLLARCRASVGAQTIPCQHVVIEDTVGLGIHGMYHDIPEHAHLVTGEYVHVLADDDYLEAHDVAERVQAVAFAKSSPEVILVRAIKNGMHLPSYTSGPPKLGQIDLGCVITRRDVWLAHVQDYGRRYEGDFDHVRAMWNCGRRFLFTDILFERGPAMHGRPE